MYYITVLLADIYYKEIEENFVWGIKGKTCIAVIFHLCGHWLKYITDSKEAHSKALKHRYIWHSCYRRHKQVINILIVLCGMKCTFRMDIFAVDPGSWKFRYSLHVLKCLSKHCCQSSELSNCLHEPCLQYRNYWYHIMWLLQMEFWPWDTWQKYSYKIQTLIMLF